MNDQISMRTIGETSAEILMYGDLGAIFKGITAKGFHEQVQKLGRVSEINLRISSDGGDVFTAVAIHNTLTRHPARIVVDIDGVAASAASVVAMAGDKIRIADDAMMMIHNPWSPYGGTSSEMRDRADRLDKLEVNCRAIYSSRTGLSDEKIDAMMEKETWMNSQECVQLGFADEVTRAMRVAAHIDRERYRHVPERFTKPLPPTIAEYRDKANRVCAKMAQTPLAGKLEGA